MLLRRHSLILLLSFLLSCLNLFGQDEPKAFTLSDIPNVQLGDSTRFVSDPLHYLSGDELRSLDKTLHDIRLTYNVDFAIVLVSSIGDEPIEDFSFELFRSWGLGQKGKDTGLLLLVVLEQKRLRFETGYGLEGIIPDAFLGQVIRNDLAPNFKRGSTALGLYLAIGRIAKRFEANKEELLLGAEARPHQRRGADNDREQRVPSSAIFYFYSFFLLFIYISILYRLYTTKQNVKRQRDARRLFPNVDKSLSRGRAIALVLLLPYLFFSLTSELSANGYAFAIALFTVLGLYQIVLYYYGKRYKKYIEDLAMHCPNCGQVSLEMTPNLEGKLTKQEQVEYEIKSKTFTCYHCTHCAHDEVVPELVKPSKYTLCSKCKTLAVAPVGRKSFRYEGARYIRTEYKCLYCGNDSHKDSRDKREDVENLAQGLLMGALLGSSMGRGRGGFTSGGGGFSGGGFSGGSWGGGFSGGGGASGSW